MGEKGEHAGHRQRMIERLKTQDVSEYEKLEILLYNALPRVNTCDLAHRLLSKFGSIKEVLSSSIEELKGVDGIGDNVAEYLFLLGKINRRYMKRPPTQFVGRGGSEEFFAYIGAFYEDLWEEVVDAYLLDEDGNVFKRVRVQYGDEDEVEFEPNELARVLVRHTPAGVIVAHNHPCGSAEPSATDIDMTKRVQAICSSHNVLFCDHVIYSSRGVYSFYRKNKLQGISSTFSISPMVKGGNHGRNEE